MSPHLVRLTAALLIVAVLLVSTALSLWVGGPVIDHDPADDFPPLPRTLKELNNRHENRPTPQQ